MGERQKARAAEAPIPSWSQLLEENAERRKARAAEAPAPSLSTAADGSVTTLTETKLITTENPSVAGNLIVGVIASLGLFAATFSVILCCFHCFKKQTEEKEHLRPSRIASFIQKSCDSVRASNEDEFRKSMSVMMNDDTVVMEHG